MLEIRETKEIYYLLFDHYAGNKRCDGKKKWVSVESLKAWVKKFRSSSGSEVEEYTWAELTKELEGF